MFKVPHRHKIPLQVKRREMTTKLCEKRKVIFWMMVESNIFSRAAERVITRVESRAMSLDAHGELGPELGAVLQENSPEHSPGAGWSCCVQGAPTQLQGRDWSQRRHSQVRAGVHPHWGVPGRSKAGSWGLWLQGHPWKPSQRHLLGPSAWKIGTVLVSGGKETGVCVIATPH